MKLTKTAWIGTLVTKSFCFWGTSSPRPPIKFIPQQNFIIPSHKIITNDFSWKWQLYHFVIVISNNCFKYAPKWMVSSLIFQKFSGEELTEPPPQTPLPLFPSHQIITYDFSWKLQLTILLVISNNCFKYAPKWMVSSFQKFSGRGSPSPLPRPLPPLFLGLRPRFGLRPQFSGASRPRLGASPSILGRFAPSIRASPSTF